MKQSYSCQSVISSQQDPLVETGIIVYRARWMVLLSFCIMAFGVAIPFVQYSPILQPAGIYYSTKQNNVVWFSNVYYLDYILLALFLVNPIQKNLDFMIIYVGAGLFLVGQVIQVSVKEHLVGAFFAYFCFGISQIVQMNCPVFIADRWFPSHERTLATSIGTLITYFGLNFGFLFPALYVSDPPDTPQSSSEYIQYRHNLNEEIDCIHYIQLGIAFVSFTMCLLFIRSEPPTPSSLLAKEKRANLKESFRKIISKWKNLMDLLTLSVFVGISWSFITIITVILPFSQRQIGWIGLIFQMCGMTSGISISILIDSQIARGQIPSYDLWLKTLLSISFISLFILALVIHKHNYQVCCVLAGFIGLGLNAYFPIALQSFVEKMYPCQELALVTFMFTFAQAFGFLSNFFIDIPILSKNGVWILTGILAPFTIYLVIGYKTELNRTNFEILRAKSMDHSLKMQNIDSMTGQKTQ